MMSSRSGRRAVVAVICALLMFGGISGCARVTLDHPIPSVALPDVESKSARFGQVVDFASGVQVTATMPMPYVPLRPVDDGTYTTGVTKLVKFAVTFTNNTGQAQEVILGATATSAGINAPQFFDLALGSNQGSGIPGNVDPGGSFTWTIILSVTDQADVTFKAQFAMDPGDIYPTATFTMR